MSDDDNRVRRRRERLAAAPAWGLFLVLAVTWTVFTVLLRVLIDPQSAQGVGLLILVVGGVLGGAIFGGLMTAFTVRARRRAGGARLSVALGRAISSGEVPPGADPAEWIPVLRERRRVLARTRVLGPVFFGAMLLVGVWLAVTMEGGYRVLGISDVVFSAGILVWSAISTPRERRAVDALLARLGG